MPYLKNAKFVHGPFYRGILITGSSIMGTNIKMPYVQSKNLISVILCEATAIYGVIIALLLAIEVGGKNVNVYANLTTY